jgi:diguanylate cyclase (GGDEF) domain
LLNEEINILIVDDRLDNLLVLESLLEDIECKIVKANSGKEALELLQGQEFALVILDVQMPEMDGFNTAKLMRAKERTRYIPIIFMTAIHEEPWSILKGYEVGAVDYLFKPVELVILQSKVKVFIELYKQKQLLKIQAELLELRVKELLELKEANGRLENLSTIDGLTGIPNRRNFDNFIEMSWRNSAREQKPFSLIMADIDYFKAFNDNYGHLKGDDCLIMVAKTLSSCVKGPTDLVARFGGEEFIAVLGTNKKGAIAVAERMRKSVEDLVIAHEYSQVSSHVTVSLGVVEIVANLSDSYHECIKNVDSVLYLAKQNGRNRVCVV